MVNSVVWGVASISLPILAGSDARAGLVFAMLNLGLAVGALIWGYIARWIALSYLIFFSTVLSALVWLALTLLDGTLLPFLAFMFGLFAAAIWALATMRVTKTYPKPKWDGRIARMQSFLVLGQVAGLFIASARAIPILGIPLLVIGILGCLPVRLRGEEAAIGRFLHSQHHIPKARNLDILSGHALVNFRLSHLVHLKNTPLVIFFARWLLILLGPAPVFAVYPLLMKGAFDIGTSMASIIFAVSTFFSVLLFSVASKLAKWRSAFFVFNVGVAICLIGFLLMFSVSWGLSGWIGVGGFALMIISWSFVSTGMNIGVVKLVSPEKESEALGLANTFMSLDNMIGGVIAGTIISQFGYNTIFIIGLGISASAFLLEFIHLPMRNALSKTA